LESNVWLRSLWTDHRLAWDKEEFAGIDRVIYSSAEVWKPDVTLYNSANLVKMMNCWDSNVIIFANGEVLWVPPCKLDSQCRLTLKKEPYGEQTCTMKFGSWTYDGIIMDLNFYGESKNMSAFDLTDMTNSSGFEVVSTNTEREVKYYSCCEEPYVSLQFNLTIKRIPGEELEKRF